MNAATTATPLLARRWNVLPWLILVIGFAASLLLFTVIRHALEDVARLRFERQAADAVSTIADRIQFYSDSLYGLGALFASQAPVSRLQFRRFVESLKLKDRFPGFDVVNYAVHVPREDKERFVESVRRDTSLDPRGYPRFAINPPGERAEYYVLAYVEPMTGFEFVFGRDLSANPGAPDPQPFRLTALHSARDSGKLTASGVPLRIKAGGKEYIGLAMRLAVYRSGMPIDTVVERRAAYLGSVGAGFNVEDLMRGVLDASTMQYIRIKLYDVRSAVGDPSVVADGVRQLLFDSDQSSRGSPAPSAAADPSSTFVHVLTIEVGGRTWEVHFSTPKNAIIGGLDAILPWIVFAGGLLSSALLFGVLYSLATSRRRAVTIADEITKDLRESEASLAEAQRVAHLGNWSLEPATWNMSWSAEAYRMFGLVPSSTRVAYADFLQRVHEDDRAALDRAIRGSVAAREECDMKHRVYRNDGSIRWVHTIAKPGRGETARDSAGEPSKVLGACLDITERKHDEEALQMSAEQLQALSRRLVDIQELERRRFSRELHDVVGQNLTALSINLGILRTQISGDGNDGLHSRLDDSAALLESTAGAIENVMAELRPPMLDDYGLLPAVKWYANDFSSRTGIGVAVQGDERMERLAPAIEIALFRIVQEALNNVAKHAHATRVELRLERPGVEFVMSVSDDGIGLDAGPISNWRRRPGLGMVTMRERAQAVGGEFAVKAAPGHGTQVVLRIPG